MTWPAAWTESPEDDLETIMLRAIEQLREQARNPSPPQPCAHIEPYPGWARQQAREGRMIVDCPWCGDPVRLPEF